MAEGVVIPNDLAQALAHVGKTKPLAPYTTVTHSGDSYALVLPDTPDGEQTSHLVLNAACEMSMRDGQIIKGLTVHGIANTRGGIPARGTMPAVPLVQAPNGIKLTIKVVDGQPVDFVNQSEKGRPGLRLIMKKDGITTVPVGSSITFERHDAGPGWRQI